MDRWSKDAMRAYAVALVVAGASLSAQADVFDGLAGNTRSEQEAKLALDAFLRIAPGSARDERLGRASEIAFVAADDAMCMRLASEAESRASLSDGALTAALRARARRGLAREFADMGERLVAGRRAAVTQAIAAEEAALLPLADAALRSGERTVGMWIFRAIAEQLPEDAARLANLALAHRHVGQLAEARRVYERALQLAPNDSWTWNDYGLLLRVAGDPAASRTAFQRSIACDAKFGEGPGITNLVVEAAQARVEESRRTQVLADASRALMVRPDAALLRRAAIDLVLRDAGVARPQQLPDKGAAVR